MKHIFFGSVLALVLLTAQPAAAEVGGSITRSGDVSREAAINNIVMAVLELFTWQSDTQTLNFDDGRYTATAGCNNIFGAYTVSGTAIDFGQPASTLMYCEGKMEAETALDTALAEATHMRFHDGKLELIAGSTTTSFAVTLPTPVGK